MLEDERDTGFGYDSDGEAEEVIDIDNGENLVRLFRLASIEDLEANKK